MMMLLLYDSLYWNEMTAARKRNATTNKQTAANLCWNLKIHGRHPLHTHLQSCIHHYCPFFISHPFHRNKSAQYSNKEDHKHEEKSIMVHLIKSSNYSAFPSYIISIHKCCHLNVSIKWWSHLLPLIKEPYISIGLTRIRVCTHLPSPSPFLSSISLPSSPLSSCLSSVLIALLENQVYGNLVIKVWIDADPQEPEPLIFKQCFFHKNQHMQSHKIP